jgi:hypothetical protein
LAGALLLPASTAAAAAPPQVGFQGLYDEYQKLGFVYGCAHRESDLRSALSSIPADIAAYDPGFADALDSALEQQASGCSGLSSPFPQNPATAAGTINADDGSPGPANQRPLGTLPAPESADTGIPAVLVVLASMLGVALLVAAVLSLSRYFGWDTGRPARAVLRPLRDRLGI